MEALPGTVLRSLARIVGEGHVLTGDAAAGFAVDWTGRFQGQAVAAVRRCGEPALILVDDADQRPDLAALLDSLAASPGSSPVRVVLIAMSTILTQLEQCSKIDIGALLHIVVCTAGQLSRLSWVPPKCRCRRSTPPAP